MKFVFALGVCVGMFIVLGMVCVWSLQFAGSLASRVWEKICSIF